MSITTTRQIESARRQIEGYKAMRDVALAHGMEYEVERCDQSIREFEREIVALGGHRSICVCADCGGIG